MVEVKCPRCARVMRHIRRMKGVYFCDTDGSIIRDTDPYVTSGDMVAPYNAGGGYNY